MATCWDAGTARQLPPRSVLPGLQTRDQLLLHLVGLGVADDLGREYSEHPQHNCRHCFNTVEAVTLKNKMTITRPTNANMTCAATVQDDDHKTLATSRN